MKIFLIAFLAVLPQIYCTGSDALLKCRSSTDEIQTNIEALETCDTDAKFDDAFKNIYMDLETTFYDYLTGTAKSVSSKVNDGYLDLLDKYPGSAEFNSTIASYQQFAKSDLELITTEELTLMQQRVLRMIKSAENSTNVSTIQAELKLLNTVYSSACELFDVLFQGIEEMHTNFQNELLTADSVETILKAIEGQQRFRIADFSIDADIQAIFTNITATPDKTPADLLGHAWDEIIQKYEVKLAEIQQKLQAESQIVRDRIAAKKDNLQESDQQQLLGQVDDSVANCLSMMDGELTQLTQLKALNLDELDNGLAIDPSFAANIFNPADMRDSREAYVLAGVRANKYATTAFEELYNIAA